MKRVVGILFIIIGIQLVSCEKEDKNSLTGTWYAYITIWTGDTANTKLLDIQLAKTDISIYESDDIISTGILRNDTINCTEFFGVTEIYVDNINHMHSNLPLAEIAGLVYFERKK